MLRVNSQNWGTCGYKTPRLQALITMGGRPSNGPSGYTLSYYITLLNADFQEIFQQEFKGLGEALKVLNTRYGRWEFFDREKEKKSGASGCDSCGAH